MPREPEKFLLRGHKSRITKVAIHPVYSDVAGASEDGSVKIWDFE
jgi:platelet-activating factor acetylhydrolase IB subunit alpha